MGAASALQAAEAEKRRAAEVRRGQEAEIARLQAEGHELRGATRALRMTVPLYLTRAAQFSAMAYVDRAAAVERMHGELLGGLRYRLCEAGASAATVRERVEALAAQLGVGAATAARVLAAPRTLQSRI